MLIQMLQKEFILILRDKHSLAALFIMPLLFIIIMSMALKDTFSNQRPLLNYGVVDKDRSDNSKTLQEFMATSSFLHDITDDSDTKPHIQIIIPKGFSSRLLEQNTSQKPLVKLLVAPDIKQEMLLIFKAKLAADIMTLRLQQVKKQLAPLLGNDFALPKIGPNDRESFLKVEYLGMKSDKQPTSTQQSVPSWIVFGMFFIIIPVSTIFIGEKKQNTLMRMASMNVSVPALFAGKVLPYMIINQLQMVVMVCGGRYIVPLLGGDPLTLGSSIFGLAMVSLSLSIAAIGTSMLIAIVATTVEQATTVGGLLNILFGAIGGVMVPKMYMPHSMQSFSNISPMSWGLEGFLDIFLRGRGVMEILPEASALTGFGLGFLLLAAAIFTKKVSV